MIKKHAKLPSMHSHGVQICRVDADFVIHHRYTEYDKTCVKQPLSKRPKIGIQYQLSLNAGQKYCRMLQGEHSAILLTIISSLNYHLSLRSLFCLFLSGRFMQVLM